MRWNNAGDGGLEDARVGGEVCGGGTWGGRGVVGGMGVW